MSDGTKPPAGSIGWIDLTVKEAGTVRDFYRELAGWRAEPVDMGGYADFTMFPAEGEQPVGGICHARGTNAAMPAQWMLYITVDDADACAARCEALGGKVRVAPRDMGSHGRYCVLEDPGGAVAAFFAPATAED
jgi:predicted enzyme related to lactoylglutathione lyase